MKTSQNPPRQKKTFFIVASRRDDFVDLYLIFFISNSQQEH